MPSDLSASSKSTVLASSPLVSRSKDSPTLAAAMFSSRCLTDDVPGMGSVTFERFRTHASATCSGVASNCFAAFSKAWCAKRCCAMGAQGMKPILFRSQ